MKQIYINTHLGTTRIDYDEHAPGDIIIVTSMIGEIQQAVHEHIECTGIEPTDIVRCVQTTNARLEDAMSSYGHQHDTEYVND